MFTKPLGEIRKSLKPDTITDIARILMLFQDICKNNPEIVRANFSEFLKLRDTDNTMVSFYRDNAEYLLRLLVTE